MSDDPVLAALARLEAKIDTGIARMETEQTRMREQFGNKLDTGIARLETEQTRMREQFGNKLDDILDKLRAVREDVDTSRGHVLYALQDGLTLSQRITKLEDEIRRPLT